MTTQETLIQLIDYLKIPAEWQGEVLMACISSYNTGVWDAAENAEIDGEWITNDLGRDVCVTGSLDKQSILKLMIK